MTNKKEIDWSKAPEGATHYSPASSEHIEGWLREHGDGVDFMRMGGTVWLKNSCLESDSVPRPKPSNVESPAHYTQADIECIEAIAAATIGKQGIKAVCVGNVIKYLWRYEVKNGVEDVKKARWYLDKLLEEMGE